MFRPGFRVIFRSKNTKILKKKCTLVEAQSIKQCIFGWLEIHNLLYFIYFH
jgi:hypothetical protein